MRSPFFVEAEGRKKKRKKRKRDSKAHTNTHAYEIHHNFMEILLVME